MYAGWLDLLKDEDLCLSDAEVGIVMMAILEYIKSGDLPKFSDRSLMAIFKSIKAQIDKDNEKYVKTCKARKEAVKKRWNDTKDTNVYKSTENDTNDTDNDNECENDYEHNSLSESMCVDVPAHTQEGTEPMAQEKVSDKAEKCAYGFFRNVYLTDGEYQDLCKEVGEDKLNKAILLLSAKIEQNGKYKNDSHAAVIRLWVLRAVEENEVKDMELKSRKKKARGSPAEAAEKAKRAGFDIEFEDVFEKP